MSTKDQALHALKVAAERVGRNAHQAGRYKVKRNRKGQVISGYTLTPEHQELIIAIDALSRDRISPEEAMAIVNQYEIVKARLEGY